MKIQDLYPPEQVDPDILDDIPLKIGDKISLLIENLETHSHGFLSVDGVVDNRFGIIEKSKDYFPEQFKDCIFMIHHANQYRATRKFKKVKISTSSHLYKRHLNNTDYMMWI